MFQLDRTSNRLHRLDERRFGDLALRERGLETGDPV